MPRPELLPPIERATERQLGDITRRLQPDWPGVDVAAVVADAYRRLAENARVTTYLPLLTEHLVRTWLSEGRVAGRDAGESAGRQGR